MQIYSNNRQHYSTVTLTTGLVEKLRWPVFIIAALFFSSPSWAENTYFKTEVIDAYIELHTGPGKGYPVFYTAEQGESITIITKRTGWYEVKAQNGQTGWVKSSQIARTLLPSGEPVDLPSISYGDYLKNSFRVGFNVGKFSSGDLKGSDVFNYNIGYRPLSWLGLELENGQFYNREVKGSTQSFNLLIEPYSEWRISPVFILGRGVLKIESQPELTPLNIDDEKFNQVGLSANYYIGRNFVLHAGYQNFTVSTANNNERLKQWNIGFKAFF
jgi:hypothetical protein